MSRPDYDPGYKEEGPSRPVRAGVLPGCMLAMSSACVTCLLLFINGSIVLALLRAFAPTGSQWARDPRLMQFLLLLLPVILVVIQWMMLDYIRSRFRRQR